MSEFHDQTAGIYHLIFPDWEESVARQAAQLSSNIHKRRPNAATTLDVFWDFVDTIYEIWRSVSWLMTGPPNGL